jgi:hypothetical protein
MKLTKLNMARWIVTALHNRPALVAADDPRAIRLAKSGTVAGLSRSFEMAVRAIRSGKHAHLVEDF